MKILKATKAMAQQSYSGINTIFQTISEDIESSEEISGIKGIGPKMSSKIDELIQSGKI